MMKRVFEKITWIFWLGLVAALPVTSFPLVAKIIHSSAVAPASLIFLGLLCITWLPCYLWNKGTFPTQTRTALLFLVVGILSTGVSFLSVVPAYKDQQLLSNVISGIVTLIIGVLFYLISSTLPHDNGKIRSTLKVLNWTGGVMLLWCLIVRIIALLAHTDTPEYLRFIQNLFSTTTFFGRRAVGFASEPSWLAHILNMVFLPYWLSATITKFSAFTKKIWHFSIENILLAVGFVILFETLSRAGLAAFLLVVGFFFIRFNLWLIRKISAHWSSRTTKLVITILLIAGFLFVYLGLAVGVVFLLSKIDPRMVDVFSISVIQGQGITKYADMLQFGERVTYWQAGWNIFNAHPLLGVGLGNAGFYFPQFLPDKAWSLAEVRKLLYHSAGLMNIKSMWSRVLAETGILGFSCFMVLLVFSGLTALQLTRAKTSMQKTIGWMGISMLIAFLIEGFSVDSFALPYLWFTLGLVAAAWRWSDSKVQEK